MKDIENFCKIYLKRYKINLDGTVNVNGTVSLSKLGLVRLPVIFNKVTGNFLCDNNNLKTLYGFPKEVGGFVSCKCNKLTSLKYSPTKAFSFDCSFNLLTSLDYATNVFNKFDCSYNKIEKFGYVPEIGNDNVNVRYESRFYCEGNPIYEIWKEYENEKNINYYLKYVSREYRRNIIIDSLLK